MEEDELERPVEPMCAIAYAFESIRRGNRAVVRRYVEQPVMDMAVASYEVRTAVIFLHSEIKFQSL